jgi:hypothetical protein
MGKIAKSLRRETQQQRAISGMQVSGRSIKSVLLPVIGKRAKAARGEREAREAAQRQRDQERGR